MPITDQEIADLMYVDPGKAVALLREQTKQEVRQEYAQHQSREQFFKDFYRENPDLSENHVDVLGVLNSRWADLETMPVSKAAIEVASLTRQKLERDRRRMNDPAAAERRVMRGGPGLDGMSAADAAVISNSQDFDEPESLSSIINRRKEARYESAGSRRLSRRGRSE
ncbi:hypothetical protein [Rhizobium sp. BK251]|uniref:hypothetical protein n=1 Tax=Rhizobium sp. BK251 TaxID=2512125 RepID=UPI00104DD454|nr:hypothetical protein [Rhizobium sp. BK251]TCL70468.1 hypothetical protein EV286_107342 [Rhizobium sp. BK251]